MIVPIKYYRVTIIRSGADRFSKEFKEQPSIGDMNSSLNEFNEKNPPAQGSRTVMYVNFYYLVENVAT